MVVTLALCIGANTAVFSVVDAVIFGPLPVPREDQLVSVYHLSLRREGRLAATSYPTYEFYKAHSEVFSGLAAFLRIPVNVKTGQQFQKVSAELVTPNYFSVLGIDPFQGRMLTASEDRVPAVVLAHDFWQKRLGADPSVIGKLLRIHKSVFTVIGIAPASFKGVVLDWGPSPEIWIPVRMYRQAVPAFEDLDFEPLEARGANWFLVTGRMRDGVTLSQAKTNLEILNRRLAKDYGDTGPGHAIELLPTRKARFWPSHRENVRRQLTLFMTATGLVLLIACLNVANIFLAEGMARQREIAIQVAVGARSLHLFRQLVTQSLFLALPGGAAGLLVAEWLKSLFLSLPKPFVIPLAVDVHLHPRAFLFSVLLSAGVGVICGLLPARQATGFNVVSALRLNVSEFKLHGVSLRNLLIVCQIAVAVVLVIWAGLLILAVQKAYPSDVAKDPEHLLVAQLELTNYGYTRTNARLFQRELLDRTRHLPAVQSAALVQNVPLSGIWAPVRIVTNPAGSGEARYAEVNLNVVSPEYFRTMGIPFSQGRDFTLQDDETTAAVGIVNEEMVQQFWAGEDPIGKGFRLESDGSFVRVVGVVRDGGRVRSVRADRQPSFYFPLQKKPRPEMRLVVRYSGDRRVLTAALANTISLLDKHLPYPEVLTMEEHLAASLSQERAAAFLLISLAILGMLLAVAGIYAVLSFFVSQRSREIAIRMALGARPQDIRRWVLRQGTILVLAGALLGLVAAWGLIPLLRSFILGVGPADAVVFLVSLVLASATALLASFIPAHRASRVEPMDVLRFE